MVALPPLKRRTPLPTLWAVLAMACVCVGWEAKVLLETNQRELRLATCAVRGAQSADLECPALH